MKKDKKIKEITLKTKPENIVEYFKEAFDKGKDINFKTRKGYIFYCGGILSKIEGNKQYFAIDNKWVEV